MGIAREISLGASQSSQDMEFPMASVTFAPFLLTSHEIHALSLPHMYDLA